MSSLGVGGESKNCIESAYLAFVDEKALYWYEIELQICKPAKELMTIPSLLGRDIIDQWRVTYNKSASEFLAEAVSSDAQQMLDD